MLVLDEVKPPESDDRPAVMLVGHAAAGQESFTEVREPGPTMMVVLVPDDIDKSEMWSARALMRAQGARVRSNVTMEGGTYSVPAGDAELVINTSASVEPLRKSLHGASGDRIEVRFSTLRRATSTEPRSQRSKYSVSFW